MRDKQNEQSLPCYLAQVLINAETVHVDSDAKAGQALVRFCDYTSIWQVSGITEVWGDQKKDSHVARYTARTARTQSSFEGPFAINACL